MTTETPSQEPEFDPQPTTIRQRLMPQSSIRSLIVLITISAVIMWIARTMFVGNMFWAKCFGAALVTIGGCFATYAGLFLLAHLFTVATSPIVDAIDTGRHDAGEHDA